VAAGDHIYVQRLGGVYAHHGIDCGDGSVIHYTGERWHAPRRVQRTPVECFADGGEILVRDYTGFFEQLANPENLPRRLRVELRHALSTLLGHSQQRRVFEPKAVIARARSRLGESRFDIVLHNCEHFATWCKTGISDSQQVYAIWRAALGPMEYWRLRGGGMLGALLDRNGPGTPETRRRSRT
jgi:Lecithin retinol acyltransferase